MNKAVAVPVQYLDISGNLTQGPTVPFPKDISKKQPPSSYALSQLNPLEFSSRASLSALLASLWAPLPEKSVSIILEISGFGWPPDTRIEFSKGTIQEEPIYRSVQTWLNAEYHEGTLYLYNFKLSNPSEGAKRIESGYLCIYSGLGKDFYFKIKDSVTTLS